jgi:citrate synthase
VRDIIRTVKDAHPMDVLRTAVSALAAFDPEAGDISAEATLRKGVRLTSQVPMIVAAHDAIRNGREPVTPDPTLGHAANFLYMLLGRMPSADAARLMDVDMILHAEHGSNASAFTARVVAGTKANLHAAITSAVAALSGPSHGGAAENVIRMAQEIGDASMVADYVKRKRANKEAVMGFGHRVYRAEDPRSRLLKQTAKELGSPRVEVAEALEQAAHEAIAKKNPDHSYTNVEFWSAIVLDVAEVPPALAPAMFACSRTAGWSAHVLEQKRLGILVRPSARYVGPGSRSLQSIA